MTLRELAEVMMVFALWLLLGFIPSVLALRRMAWLREYLCLPDLESKTA